MKFLIIYCSVEDLQNGAPALSIFNAYEITSVCCFSEIDLFVLH